MSIYFEFDSAELSSDSRNALQSFFDGAQKRPDTRVRIEGNCDERGIREYNLAPRPAARGRSKDLPGAAGARR